MSRGTPIVVLIGRQNVGKSTLFNTLVEERRAIVSPIAGTTRDRTTARVSWRGRSWTLVDTGGMEQRPADDLGTAVRAQAQRAATGADVICFVVDAKEGLTEEDVAIARFLRTIHVPVILVRNKLEAARQRAVMDTEILALGFGEGMAISAKNGVGTGDLLDAIAEEVPAPVIAEDAEEVRLAIVGRPNVGKSSLLNRLLGEERVLVSPTPHTTRDPQDIVLTFEGTRFRLVDTAGMRRRVKRLQALRRQEDATLEEISVQRAMGELEHADVAALVLDALEPVTSQDRHIAEAILNAGVGVILVINKWDAIEGKEVDAPQKAERIVRNGMPFLAWAPIVFVSALTGQRVRTLLPLTRTITEARSRRFSQRSVDRFLHRIIQHRPPTRGKGTRRPRLVSLAQTGTKPPTFHLIVGPRQDLAVAYQRYVVNELRTYYHLEGTPIRLTMEQQLRSV